MKRSEMIEKLDEIFVECSNFNDAGESMSTDWSKFLTKLEEAGMQYVNDIDEYGTSLDWDEE